MVTLYVEGGGDTADLHGRCRAGFSGLLKSAGFAGRLPRIVAGGSRNKAFDLFRSAHEQRPGSIALLLVDSEDPITQAPWEHLRARDGWNRPAGATDERVHFMATCMETWLVADRDALRRHFGSDFNERGLPPVQNLEGRSRAAVLACLDQATIRCNAGRRYSKGAVSFALLGSLDPNVLQKHLVYFQRLIETLNQLL